MFRAKPAIVTVGAIIGGVGGVVPAVAQRDLCDILPWLPPCHRYFGATTN